MDVLTAVVKDKTFSISINLDDKFDVNEDLQITQHHFEMIHEDETIGICAASPFVTPKMCGVFISHFEIKEDYRKQGCGRIFYRIIEHLYKEEGFSKIELSTPETNNEGKAFWIKMGFEFDKVNFSKYI